MSDFWKQQSTNPEIAQKNAEIPYAQETKENFAKIEKFAKNPEQTISDFAQEKIDKVTTGMLDKASEWAEKATPEWLKKVDDILEKYLPFYKEAKEWFTEKMGGIKNWIIWGIWGILGIDFLKEGIFGKKEEKETPDLVEQITENEYIKDAKELLNSKEISSMTTWMVDFMKETAGHLDEDMEKNPLYAKFKKMWGSLGEIKKLTPIKFIAGLLEDGIGKEKIQEWSQDFKSKSEIVFWTGVSAVLGYKFITGGKTTKTAITAFLLYGLDHKFTDGKITEATIEGTIWVTEDFIDITGKWIDFAGANHLAEVIKNRENLDWLAFIEQVIEAFKKDLIPATFGFIWGAFIATLYIWGKWIVWKPAQAFAEVAWDCVTLNFEDTLGTIIEWQWPIMITAGAWTLVKTRGNVFKALQSAWKITLPRLALTHKWNLDVEMAFKNLTNWKTFTRTQESAVKKAQYLAKKAAYYQDIDATEFNKIKGDLVGLIKNIETNNKNWKWNIKEISGVLKEKPWIGINVDTAENLIKDARAYWYEKTTLWDKAKNKFQKAHTLELKTGETILYTDATGKTLQAEILEIDPNNPEKLKLKDSSGKDFSVEKKDLKNLQKIKPEALQGRSKEINLELENEIKKLGTEFDAEHKKLVEAIARGNQAEIAQAKANFESQKTHILGEAKKTYQKFGKDYLEAMKKNPVSLGHFGKISLKGATYVYVWLEAGRIIKMFAQGETKSGTMAAVDLGLRLAPVAGTIMDAQDTWKYLKNGDFKQAGISGAFTVVGGISDALWITGFGGAASRAGISGLKVAKIGIKGAKTAKVLGEVEKGKDAVKAVETGIKKTVKETGEKITTTTGKIVEKIPAKQALKLSAPMLALYLYENLKPTEEEIK